MRRQHRRCPDTSHRNPDLPCPYCTSARDDQADIISAVRRRHARTHAEDVDGFGWSS
ncbi:hypothetical protein [Dactylosporangium sp. CS-033363]|uniref:hypothetical protein n=1 Tax=Dactylosporangium sp. CS-033363 TaxID=3239935 RepID=UPI003D92B20C